MGNGDTGGDRDRVGAISRVVRCGPGRAGRHFACGAERCGAGQPPPPFRVWCGAGPGRHFASSQGPAVPPLTEARVKVMARFSPECAVVLLEHLDTPVTRFLLSLPPLSRLFEAQVSPRRAPHRHPSQWGWVAPPLLLLHQNEHPVEQEEPACAWRACSSPVSTQQHRARVCMASHVSSQPFFLLSYRKRKSPASQQRMQFWHPSVS